MHHLTCKKHGVPDISDTVYELVLKSVVTQIDFESADVRDRVVKPVSSGLLFLCTIDAVPLPGLSPTQSARSYRVIIMNRPTAEQPIYRVNW